MNRAVPARVAPWSLLLIAGLHMACAHAGSLALRTAVGTNLDSIAHFSPQIPFADVMKSSSPWISGDRSKWDNGQRLDVDERGWVRSLAAGQIARKLMLREIGTRYPAGRYVVRYQGEGVLNFGFAAKVVSRKPGEMVLEVTPASGGIHLAIEATNPQNYLREIAVYLPGGTCEGDPFRHAASAAECHGQKYLAFSARASRVRFNPVFLDRLRNYSALRFMDWMRTNDSPVSAWSERAKLEDASWTSDRGAPVEVMVSLANIVDAHPWFTIPHRADAEYVERFAQLVQELLRPDLGVFVEHSNEVWNAQFKQYGYAVERAKSAETPLDNVRYHALRTRDIGAAFSRALGPGRVVAVLGAQAGNRWTATHGLEFLKSRYGARGLGIDAIAIAPYFGVAPAPAEAPAIAAMTLDAFFRHVRSKVMPQMREIMTSYRKIADAHALSLLSYEGGQHMVGLYGAVNHEPLNVLFDAFNRDPRVGELYLEYLESWKQAGGRLFVHYNDVGRFTKWGRWGALEYVAQPRESAPKFDAIQTFIERNPPWW